MSLETDFHSLFHVEDVSKKPRLPEKPTRSNEKLKVIKRGNHQNNHHYNHHYNEPKGDDNFNGLNRAKYPTSSDSAIVQGMAPFIELNNNPSIFAVFSSVRQCVLENKLKESAILQGFSLQAASEENPGNEEEKSKPEDYKVPKVIELGLCVVFELIRESRLTHQSLCNRALHALLDTLQGQQPEGLRSEPNEVIDSLFELLLDLAPICYQAEEDVSYSRTMESLMKSVACSCLLSLVVARGDTGKMLTAISTLLTSPSLVYDSDDIETPAILVTLQRCVQAVLLGKTTKPQWSTHGFPCSSLCDSFPLILEKDFSASESSGTCSVAFDGKYLYILLGDSLFKVGSGYGSTLKGQCLLKRELSKKYATNVTDRKWIGYAAGYIYLQANNWTKNELIKIDTVSLKEVGVVTLGVSELNPSACASDGEFLLLITANKDDSFVLRTLKPSTSAAPVSSGQTTPNTPSYLMPVVQELYLKLAHRRFIFAGLSSNSIFDPSESDIITTVEVAFKNIAVYDEEISQITVGKDFSIVKTQSGKVFYSGKGPSLGLKQSSVNKKWYCELPIAKSPRISSLSVGHESSHCLLLSEDGTVYFTGLAKRGEDGEQNRGRRQPKPVKPKRMIKMEGKHVVQAACNHGTSALVTKDGELFMFGKDATHTDRNSGQVTALKNAVIVQVALGKAHVLVLTNKGHVYTFGFNHKGQCGLEQIQQLNDRSTSGLSPGTSTKTNAAQGDELDCAQEHLIDISEDAEPICSSRSHRWKYDQCMICTSCGECTGYGPGCVASGKSEVRNPGMPCGCGGGDSGCSDCGICKACDAAVRENLEEGSLPVVPPYKDAYGQNFANALQNPVVDLDACRGAAVVLVHDIAANEHEFENGGLFRMPKNDHIPPAVMQRLNQGLARIDRRRIALDAHINRRLRHVSRVYKNMGAVDARNRCHIEEIEKNPGVLHCDDTGAGSDCEGSKLTSIPPTKLAISQRVIQVACGLHHSVLLTNSGEVYTFGSNQQGQLGLGDFILRDKPVKLSLDASIVQIAAGSNHTVLLTSQGQVYTFGSNQQGQLGRIPSSDSIWKAIPGLVPNVGPQYGRRATWIGACGHYTFVKLDESLISPSILRSARVVADKRCVIIVPPGDDTQPESERQFSALVVNRNDGVCKLFSGSDQLDPSSFSSACLDDAYGVLWTYHSFSHVLNRYNIIASEVKMFSKFSSENPFMCTPAILSPEIALPDRSITTVSKQTACLNLLCALETLTTASQLGLTIQDDELSKSQTLKTYSKEDFSSVNRFESHGGGWGYSGHSIEAIRFMTDCDVICGGFGLFGGRGEYVAKLKLYDIGMEGGEQEGDGELLVETDEVPYECGARHKYPILFEEPVTLQGNRWYVAWARISGPSSDCGSSGQSVVNSEDQVTFYFKSSKKSNNGTDVNAGQIPQILYKVVNTSAESIGQGSSSQSHCDQLDKPVCILSRDFCTAVSPECFTSLLKLLRWSWQSFKATLCELVSGVSSKTTEKESVILELKHFAYICCASLHLLKVYIKETFPNNHCKKQNAADLVRLAEAVGDTRTLMKMILSDPPPAAFKSRRSSDKLSDLPSLVTHIITECHDAFTSCYHAFYPNATLKWRGLCDLLLTVDVPWSHGSSDNLLAAVLASLCNPNVRLISTFPLYQGLDVHSLQSPSGIVSPVSGAIASEAFQSQDPILIEKMVEKSDREGCHSGLECSFHDLLIKLLAIVGQPVQCLLYKEQESTLSLAKDTDYDDKVPEQSPPSTKLVDHTCNLFSAMLTELVAQGSGIGLDAGPALSQTLHVLPSRFSRVSQNRTWNTGNGSPDAICFSVDRPYISIVGVTVYGGVGSEWHYEIELLDYQGGSMGSTRAANERNYRDSSQNHQWRTLEAARGTYTMQDKACDVAELKFDRPVRLRENVKYAIRLRNHGPRTNNGDGGLTHVRGPDGTTFTFSDCSLSYNGTNHKRGQIPQIMYYSTPPTALQADDSSGKIADEFQARRNALAISEAIFAFSVDLLSQAQELRNVDTFMQISSSLIVTKLLPSVTSILAPVAAVDSKIATQILSMLHQLLPLVGKLNKIADEVFHCNTYVKNLVTTSRHYVIVESDHPYKPAGVYNYKVCFPKCVKWLSLEFDARCGTAQPEDSLQIYVSSIKRSYNDNNAPTEPQVSKEENIPAQYWPVLRRFSGKPASKSWPTGAVILPGNEILFSLETASDYVKDDKASFYGFRCQVIGFENPFIERGFCGFQLLEQELTFLGSLCVSSLLNRSLSLPALVNECEYDEDAILKKIQVHSSLLNKGLSLSYFPSAQEALDGFLPLCHERPFLKDFVHCTPGTSGGRLASWMQPESYIDPNNCEVSVSSASGNEARCGWPTIITVTTKDQYGNVVSVPHLSVKIFAQPFHTNTGSEEPCKVSSLENSNSSLGNLQSPQTVPYEITVQDKMLYHAITMMKAYENYSFEELRYVAPVKKRNAESMLVRSNTDGTYTAHWTPGSAGWYQLKVFIDNAVIHATQSIHVGEPSKDLTGSEVNLELPKNIAKSNSGRIQRFVAENSAGLRIRALPSLQSEQIGVVKFGETITTLDEVHNSDGIWVRLGLESVRKYCSNSQQSMELWALQYNQHLGKTLLIPVEEAKTIPNGMPPPVVDTTVFKGTNKSGTTHDVPAIFHVVKCGVSGHNIRSYHSLRAPPVGVLVLGNVVGASKSVVNMDGRWLKLDDDSKKRYCFNTEGEAWTLVESSSEVTYLQHEREVMLIVCTDESDMEDTKSSSFRNRADDDVNIRDAVPFSDELISSSNSVNLAEKQSSLAKSRSSIPNLSQSYASESELDSLNSSTAGNISLSSTTVCGLPESQKKETEGTMSFASNRVAALQKKLLSDTTASIASSTVGRHNSSSSALPELTGINVKEIVKQLGSREGSPTSPATPPTTPKHASRSSSPVTYLNRKHSLASSPIAIRKSVSGRRSSVSNDTSSFVEGRDTVLRQVSQKGTQTSPPSDIKAFAGKQGQNVSCTVQAENKSGRLPTSSTNPGTAFASFEAEQLFKHHYQSNQHKKPAKEAISNSVAECLRAVFAAFIWHEGILHDAMAAASYLKFHPLLKKESIKKEKNNEQNNGVKHRDSSTTIKRKAKFRHSVEVSQLSILQHECYENGNLAPSKALNEMENALEDEIGQEHKEEVGNNDANEDESSHFGVPDTLVYLLTLWDEVSNACLFSLVNPPSLAVTPVMENPATTPVQMFSRIMPDRTPVEPYLDDKCSNYQHSQLHKKKLQNMKNKLNLMRNPSVHVRDSIAQQINKYSDRSANYSCNGIPSYDPKEFTVCELCDTSFPYPVTHHMRKAHPGCGEHAGGKGYNSSGSFCGGWAGHCGDGGIASSNWYLICDRCRDKYLLAKKTTKTRPLPTASSSKPPTKPDLSLDKPLTSSMEVQQIIKDNAMFLLKLSSSMEENADWNDSKTKMQEFSAYDTGFQCLEALGIQQNTYKQRLAEENLSEDEIRAIQNGRPAASDQETTDLGGSSKSKDKAEFHRSVSIGLNDQERMTATLRKRATSTEISGSYLLCQPSSALSKLMQSYEQQQKLSHYSARQARPQFPYQRPVITFVLQQHDLQGLLMAMKDAVRKAACRAFAFNALNWLLRTVTQPIPLHDLMWSFVNAMTPRSGEIKDDGEDYAVPNAQEKKEVLETDMYYHAYSGVSLHPLTDLTVAGEGVKPLLESFHTVLHTISDIMPLLPVGSPLQQIAIRCFCLHFESSDHSFLHRCHVFSNISKILSRGEEEQSVAAVIEELQTQPAQKIQMTTTETFQDITQQLELKASSRQAMIGSLTDNSTETFWESGDEDRNKLKNITITCSIPKLQMKFVYLHIDNCRDLGSKVTQVYFKYGEQSFSEHQFVRLKSCNVDNRFSGWLHCALPQSKSLRVIRIEAKGPDNTLRLRQIKVLGFLEDNIKEVVKPVSNFPHIQQLNCEAETLRVFRLLTSQVFGKLISGSESESMDSVKGEQQIEQIMDADCNPGCEGNDLREHMVGILFSRSSKLSHLQKQVCSHIVHAIRIEAVRVRDEWETLLCSKSRSGQASNDIPSDAYCFELLSMVLALSGSSIGRQYVAQQNNLLLDLFSLLHTGSARVQRQVTSLLRRVLPEIQPSRMAAILNVPSLPSSDFLVTSNRDEEFDLNRTGLLDVFLACVAKALTVQTKVKGSLSGSNKNMQSATLATSIHPRDSLGDRWFLRGCMSRKLAEVIIQLLKDMAAGKLNETWATVTRNAIAENIINLTRITKNHRNPNECIKTPTLWLALSSLCVLDHDQADRLSSSHWVASAAGDQANGNQPSQLTKPCCDNHDDNETLAIILCSVCGNLCGDCDRYLHLHRKTRIHQRQVFKEEEEAIKVDLHEGCGRTKLFWLMALADSKTLKAMVEFRGENNRNKSSLCVTSGVPGQPGTGVCRFCGNSEASGLLAIGNVCSEVDCQEHARNACEKILPCGHQCCGVKNESPCLPCLHNCATEQSNLKQDADDMCMICFTEALSCAPSLQLTCGHVFHLHCCRNVLLKKWPGPRITFTFSLCPICKETIDHPMLKDLLKPIRILYEDVKRKALMRLEYEGLYRSEAITTPGARFYNNPEEYAMERYAYYVCCKCDKAYYGGEARCDADAGIGENYDPSELMCGACSDVTQAQMCPKHGTDFLEYKCRYCCSVAVFFCFGTTHFCKACHDDFQRVTNIPKQELPPCPAGPRAKYLEGTECPLHVKHPPTGEEFALGCSVCRNAHTF